MYSQWTENRDVVTDLLLSPILCVLNLMEESTYCHDIVIITYESLVLMLLCDRQRNAVGVLAVMYYVIDRPGVAGAVLQTASSFIK